MLERGKNPEEFETERDKLKGQVQAIKESFSYRLGNMLVQAVYNPGRHTMFLPHRLIRLCVAEVKKRKMNTAKRHVEMQSPGPELRDRYVEVKLANLTLNAHTTRIRKKYIERFGIDNNRYGTYLETDWKRIEYISSLLPESKSILDVGMGNGAFLNLLMSINRSQRILGIDIRRHSKFIMIFERQSYQVMHGSITNLPMADKSVDIVTCMEVLEHLDEKSFLAALPELRRVVNHLLIITIPYDEPEPRPPYHKLRFTDKDLLTYFPDGDFILLRKPTGTAWITILEHP
jgi:2-polyprenyl-3-methyl-5-hydroxy-6-metoxy-1,4-benzoquinol methylase